MGVMVVFRLKIFLSAHEDKSNFVTLAVRPSHSTFLMSLGQHSNVALLKMRYV